jgi:MYXO-CTERM domain-containing protein
MKQVKVFLYLLSNKNDKYLKKMLLLFGYKYSGMKSNKKTFFRSVKLLILLFALTFSTKTKANTPVASSALSNVVATTSDVNIVPLQIHSLTWGWRWIKRWWNNNCQTCGASSCGGHSGGDGHSDDGDGCSGGNGGDAVPLDGGLGILALGAAAFGVRKLRGNKHDKI